MRDAGGPAIQRIARVLARLEDLLLAVLLTGMILLAAGQIFSRNLLSQGLLWGEPLLRLLVLWIALLGAMAATREGRHIRIDLLSRFLPAAAQAWSRRFTDAFSAVICGLMAWHAGRFVVDEWHGGLEFFSGVPAWSVQLIIPFGFAVMSLRFALHSLFGPPTETSA